MAIDTDTKKLSVMEWCQIWEPGLPLSPGTIGQDDQQHLLWGQSDELWGTLFTATGSSDFPNIWIFING